MEPNIDKTTGGHKGGRPRTQNPQYRRSFPVSLSEDELRELDGFLAGKPLGTFLRENGLAMARGQLVHYQGITEASPVYIEEE